MEFGALQMTKYGVFDTTAKYPDGLVTQPRIVQEYEIELFTADQAGVTYLNGEEVALKKGTFLCARPGMQRHSRLPFRCLCLHLSTQDSYLIEMLNKLPKQCVLSDISTVVSLFHRILALDPVIFPEERILLQGYILQLCYLLLHEAGAGRGNMLSAHHKTMQQVEQYIRQNPREDLELKTLAAYVNLSPSYFHKIFTRHFGITPGEYVFNCRIATAKTLLLNDDISMEDVSINSGFSSQSYFNYCFKQETGQTPLQYRKEHLSRKEV